nr:MAG TPA: hypothetical protein [Bacteriophage sp.]
MCLTRRKEVVKSTSLKLKSNRHWRKTKNERQGE